MDGHVLADSKWTILKSKSGRPRLLLRESGKPFEHFFDRLLLSLRLSTLIKAAHFGSEDGSLKTSPYKWRSSWVQDRLLSSAFIYLDRPLYSWLVYLTKNHKFQFLEKMFRQFGRFGSRFGRQSYRFSGDEAQQMTWGQYFFSTHFWNVFYIIFHLLFDQNSTDGGSESMIF